MYKNKIYFIAEATGQATDAPILLWDLANNVHARWSRYITHVIISKRSLKTIDNIIKITVIILCAHARAFICKPGANVVVFSGIFVR